MENTKESVVEKRVKSTVIRRRVRTKVAEEEAPAPVKEEAAAPKSEESEEPKEVAATPAEESTPTTEEPAPKPVAKEKEEASHSKKAARKRTRDELLMEEYQRAGGLKQVARLSTGEAEEEEKPATPEHLTRVFQPERQSRRKRVMGKKDFKKTAVTTPSARKRKIKIKDAVTVADLSQSMGVKAGAVIQKIAELGSMVTINQSLDHDTASLVAQEFGYEIENVAFREEHIIPTEQLQEESESEEVKEPRAPVVTVMGHVDHGKTSLLDYIRKAKVVEGEAGGITQHIGAYEVKLPKGQITFVDTPGHEAFTAMRARGAQVTDIVILVVAADDGVKPQTIEAINHAKAAEVPIIVAINKIDTTGADTEKVKRELSEQGLVAEDWGGDAIMVPISAKTGKGIDSLLEMLLLQAEVLELKANSKKLANGFVLEAKLEKGRGPVVTVIVEEGTLKRGDALVAGQCGGKVRALIDSTGKTVKAAGPAVPVEVLGLSEVPKAGDRFDAIGSEEDAKKVNQYRQEQEQKEKQEAGKPPSSLEALYESVAESERTELKLVVKGDVQGSIEALRDALQRLETEKVKVNILHSAVGAITESDVMLAEVSRAMIIGFNVRPDGKAKKEAETNGVEIRLYRVIYEALEELKAAMEGMLEPIQEEEYMGRAEVRDLFRVSKVGMIGGSSVTDGKMLRGVHARLLRDQTVVYEGKISSLRRFKDDVKEVGQGYECGIGLEKFDDLKVGDVIEAYQVKEVAARL